MMGPEWMKRKLQTISEKDKIVCLNALGALVVKGAALIVALFTMPAYMRFFSDQQMLGVWLTVLSVLTWILNFDLGVGNGLRNRLTIALAEGNLTTAKEYISSAYWMIGIVVTILFGVGRFLIPHINWNEVFNVTTEVVPASALWEVVLYAYVGIILQFFLRLISSVIYAMQKSAINNVISLITSVLQLLFALSAPSLSPLENLRMFAIAYIFCANVPLVVATIFVFAGEMKACAPKIQLFRLDRAKEVLSLGGIFFICQILYMLIANTNEFFISRYASPKYVVEYQIYNRVFSLGSTLFMLALTPVWSAVSKAIAEKDFVWLRKLNRRLLGLSWIATLAQFLFIPFLQIFVDMWLGSDSITINYGYAICFALFSAAMVFQGATSTIVNGMGRMKLQAICYAIGSAFKFLIIPNIEMNQWIAVVFVNSLILIPYIVIQQIETTRFINRQLWI